MLELDSHRYGAGASLWPKKWTHEQQLSQKTTFSPIVIFSIPFLESYLLDQDILHWQQKNSKFSHQLSSEVTSCHHLSIIIITSYQVSSSIIDQPIWTCFIEHVSAPDVTKIPMYALKSSKITYQDPFWNVWIPITTPSIVREPFGELFESQIQTQNIENPLENFLSPR